MERLLGAAIAAVAALVLVDSFVRRRGRPILRPIRISPTARRSLMNILAAVSAFLTLPTLVPALRTGIFAFCSVCAMSPQAVAGVTSPGSFAESFLLATWYYAATVLPIFILACYLSGVIAVKSGAFPIRGVWRSFALAAVLPVCSCGSVPLGKAIIDRGGSGARDGLVFLATAPLLSPVVIVLAFSMLGTAYAVARIVGSALVALAVAYVVRPFLKPGATGTVECRGCDTCCGGDEDQGRSGASVPLVAGAASGSVALVGWRYLLSLIRFALYGIVLGALFTAALPPEYIAAIIRPGASATAIAVVAGVPINMCGGEEILLSTPLVGMGLSLGSALAFALASTGICIGSIPLLAAALGKRAVLAFMCVYLIVPFLLGLVLDALPLTVKFGMQPF